MVQLRTIERKDNEVTLTNVHNISKAGTKANGEHHEHQETHKYVKPKHKCNEHKPYAVRQPE